MVLNKSQQKDVVNKVLRGTDWSIIVKEYNITVQDIKDIMRKNKTNDKRAVDLYCLHRSLYRVLPDKVCKSIVTYLDSIDIKSLQELALRLNTYNKKRLKYEKELLYVLDDVKEVYIGKSIEMTKDFVQFFIENDAVDCLDFLLMNKITTLASAKRELTLIVNNPTMYLYWDYNIVCKLIDLLDGEKVYSSKRYYNDSILNAMSQLVYRTSITDINLESVKTLCNIVIPRSQLDTKKNYTLGEIAGYICDYINRNINNKSITFDGTVQFVLVALFGPAGYNAISNNLLSSVPNLKAVYLDGYIDIQYGPNQYLHHYAFPFM